MKKCQYCGCEIRESSNFCPKCGKSTVNVNQVNTASEESDKQPSQIYIIISWVFYLIGFADFLLGNFFKIDFTGVWWSPLVFGGIGYFFDYLAKKE